MILYSKPVWNFSGIQKINLAQAWQIQLISSLDSKFPTHRDQILSCNKLLIAFVKPNVSEKYRFYTLIFWYLFYSSLLRDLFIGIT